MKADELTAPEQAVLVAVVRHLVMLDGEVSDSELYDIIRIGTEIGKDDFRIAIDATESFFEDRVQVLAQLGGVERPEVREKIQSELQRIAEGDGVHEKERGFLEEARVVWDD